MGRVQGLNAHILLVVMGLQSMITRVKKCGAGEVDSDTPTNNVFEAYDLLKVLEAL